MASISPNGQKTAAVQNGPIPWLQQELIFTKWLDLYNMVLVSIIEAS